MINFLIITHGEFGAYLVEAAEAIAGPQRVGVRVVSISSRAAVGDIRDRLKHAVEDISRGEGLIVFTDMPGGTPGNLAFPIIKDKPRVEIVSGVNLYMLISAFSHREDYGFRELIDKVIADGRKSICDIRPMFLAKTSGRT